MSSSIVVIAAGERSTEAVLAAEALRRAATAAGRSVTIEIRSDQGVLGALSGELASTATEVMVVGEADPLLDDTLELAQRWRQVADVELNRLPQAPHGFIHFPTAMARATCVHAQEWMRARFAEAGANTSPELTKTSKNLELSA